MSTSIGEAILDLRANLDKLESELDKSKKPIEKKASEIENVFKALASSAIIAGIVKTYTELIKAGEEAAVTEAKVAGVLRATGNAAGYTVGQLGAMADEFSRLTGFDDEMIMNAEAVLLTFRQIGHEIFPEAMQAAIDMSAVLGGDLQSAVLSAGKAMNDFSGYSILKKQGVSFTDEQVEQIENFKKTNDLIGYQNLILGELQAEFGGTAEAMEQASAGGKRLEVSVGNLKEEMGKGMIPAQRVWNYLLAETVDGITENVTESNRYADAQRKAINIMNQSGQAVILSRAQFNMHRDEIRANTAEIMRWTAIGNAWEERLAAEGTLVGELGAELKEVDYKSLLNLAMSLTQENQKFSASQETVRAKQAEIKAEIDLLISQGWSPLSDKVLALQTDYSNLGLKYDENALKHKAATDKILYDLFIQKISVDGVTTAEYEMALQAGLAFGQIDQTAIDTAKNFDLVAQAVTDGKLKVEDMQAALDLLPTYKSIDVVINALVHTASDLVTGHEQGVGMQGGYSTGTDGWLEVPSGYPDDSYPVMVSSGEMFAVIPNGSSPSMMGDSSLDMGSVQLPGGGGGMPPIQFVYQPFIGVNDENEAKNKLRSIVNDLSREASRK